MTREEHLMTIAAEECAEVAQRIFKAQRFGMEQIQEDADDKPEENPERLTNRERIWREWCDLVAAMRMLNIPCASIERLDVKRAKVERYLLRSERCGTLAAEAQSGGEPEAVQPANTQSDLSCSTCVSTRTRLQGLRDQWQESARRAFANAENKGIPALDRRQCFGVSQAYERCADELDALLGPPSGDTEPRS